MKITDGPSGGATSSGGGGGGSVVSVSKVVILVAVLVGAASALVALVTYWLMRERWVGMGGRVGGSMGVQVVLVAGGRLGSRG